MNRKTVAVLAVVSLFVTALAFVVATQYVASALAYQPRLGPPLGSALGFHLYAPWSWLAWDSDYGPYAPAVFRTAKFLCLVPTSAVLLPLVAVSLVAGRARAGSTAHGSARWATTQELAAAGLATGNGVVLCQTADARYSRSEQRDGSIKWRLQRRGRLVTHAGPEHVIVFAPTRSGKGVGTVIPTLLSWLDSVLVYDIKKELWTLTAGYRRKFSRCWRFEPTAKDSIRFNPLLEVRRGDNEVRDTQNIADILVDPDGSEKRDHWKTSAHTLLVGAILHVLYAESDKSLRGVARFLSNPDRPIYHTFQYMLGTSHLPNGPHPVVAQCAREMMDKSDNELASVVSTAKTCVNLYNDPLIARNTSTSDFRITDLMQAADPVSLYLVVPPSDIDRTRPLIRLLLNQIGRRLTERMEFGGERAFRHRLLFLLDEFPSLGKLSFFETQMAYLAGYGIKAFLIAQSLNQLEKAYGPNNAILDNCHVRMTYTANDDRTAKRISDLVGQQTHTKKQRSFSGGRFFGKVSESEQEHARALLTPDEVLRLPYEDALLLVAGLPPYRGRKLMYYLDERLKGRAGLKTPDSARQRRSELLPNRAPSDWEAVSHANPETTPLPVPLAGQSGSPGVESAVTFHVEQSVHVASTNAVLSPPGLAAVHVPAASSTLPSSASARGLSTDGFANFFPRALPPSTVGESPVPTDDAEPSDELDEELPL
jgi:type IV secretion system protein VirD4